MSLEQDAAIIEPRNEHKTSVIWLHGLGADGYDLGALIPALNFEDDLGIRYIFPNAPLRPVTINDGMIMRAWYDIKSPNLHEMEDIETIMQSHEFISQYIDEEINKGIPAKKIILAGFSQGGAIALHTGLRYPQALGGLVALSSYLPVPDLFEQENSDHKNMPILMAHGVADVVIPIEQGHASSKILEKHGYTVSWQEYMLEHEVCLEEISDVSAWMQKILV